MSAAVKLKNKYEAIKEVTIHVPATGGELWQGYIGDRLMLVNCPIDYFAQIRIKRSFGPESVEIPPNYELLKQAARRIRPYLGRSSSCEIEVLNAVPRGLGMASSTSELAAVLYGLARAHFVNEKNSRDLAHQIITQLDSGVDGNYRPGINLVSPKTGELFNSFSKIPPLKMLLVSTGGSVTTAGMDREKEKYVASKNYISMQSSLMKMIRGLQHGDVRLIGEAATENTLLYQKILKKPKLDKVIAITESSGLLGICSGHSGTTLGLLATSDFQYESIASRIEKLYGSESIIGQQQIISGGIYES